MRDITRGHRFAVRWRPIVAAAMVAVVASAGLIASASAATSGGEGHTPAPVEATLHGHVAVEVLMRLLDSGLVPPEAAGAIQRLVGEHETLRSAQAEGRASASGGPGVICRRAAENPDANPEITERCRAWAASQGEGSERPSRAELCRRALENPEADPKLTRACRTWMATLGDGTSSTASGVCRRLAAAGEHSSLAAEVRERCAAWIDSQGTPAERPTRHEICKRALENPDAGPRLTKACRVWLNAQDGSNEMRQRALPPRDRAEALLERVRSAEPKPARIGVTIEE
jgi:hypothetical protein